MHFDLKFSESNVRIDLDFREIYKASDGGFERGYEEGYKSGKADGYTEGHADGVEDGKEISYNDGMDAIVNGTVVSYSNATIKKFPVSYFLNCTMLESVSLPAMTHLSGFQGCTALKECDFSGAIYIQTSAFKGCASLVELRFPSAEQIHSNVFENCTSLSKLILERKGQIVTLGSVNSFTNTPIKSGTGFVYVTDDLVDKYKVANNWLTYAEQIKPISELST